MIRRRDFLRALVALPALPTVLEQVAAPVVEWTGEWVIPQGSLIVDIVDTGRFNYSNVVCTPLTIEALQRARELILAQADAPYRTPEPWDWRLP